MSQTSVDVASRAAAPQTMLRRVSGSEIRSQLDAWRSFVCEQRETSLNGDPAWLLALAAGRRHVPVCLEARSGDRIIGLLPLALVEGPIFGRFLVGLPFLGSGGVRCQDEGTAIELVEQAVDLADELDVDYLELRHERTVAHPALSQVVTDKVHMRMPLPPTADELWKQVRGKIRNQVRKADRLGFQEAWGGEELLDEFCGVYARRMRDLGSPADGPLLFASILAHFPQQAELCVVRQDGCPVAGALVLHGSGTTEMSRGAALSDLRAAAVNTWLQWRILLRAIERGNRMFDFGRPTIDSSVYTFKKRFGATAQPSVWQHYVRRISPGKMRKSGGKHGALIKMWSSMPLAATRWLGPAIARGIP